jgi:hypothetical protein
MRTKTLFKNAGAFENFRAVVNAGQTATLIQANGPAGREPGSIDELIGLLDRQVLDSRFEERGGFAIRNPICFNGMPLFQTPVVAFSGNFLRIPHLFDLFTNDADIIARLERAIATNLGRHEYRMQRLHAA